MNVKTLACLGLVTLLPALPAAAAPVSVEFSGVLTRVSAQSKPLPPDLHPDAPFTMIVTYDPALLVANPENPPIPGYAIYYTGNRAAFGMALRIGSWELNTTPSANSHANSLIIRDGDQGYDEFNVDVAYPEIWMDHAPVPGGAGGLVVDLRDATRTAWNSVVPPSQLPPLEAFTTSHHIQAGVADVDPATGGFTWWYSVSGEITRLSNQPRPLLRVVRGPDDTVRLSWPVILQGFVLQSSPDPSFAKWTAVVGAATDTPTEHVVTVAGGAGPRWYRLAKP